MATINRSVPAARHQQIMVWLEEEKSLSIREIESRLGVSHMTVHRDLDQLAKQNLIRKVRAGAILIPAAERQSINQDNCHMCGRRVTRRTEFIIMRQAKTQRTACCPHCGLLLLANGAEETALARDFLYGQMVNVYQAYYLLGSNVQLCCVPTILCFSGISDAQKFSLGFGGQVMDFSAALRHLTTSHQKGHQ